MKIERDKLYVTRSGEIRRVVCVDAPGMFPIISVPADKHSRYSCTVHVADGHECGKDSETEQDLIAEHHEPRRFWIHPGPMMKMKGYTSYTCSIQESKPDPDVYELEDWIEVVEVQAPGGSR